MSDIALLDSVSQTWGASSLHKLFWDSTYFALDGQQSSDWGLSRTTDVKPSDRNTHCESPTAILNLNFANFPENCVHELNEPPVSASCPAGPLPSWTSGFCPRVPTSCDDVKSAEELERSSMLSRQFPSDTYSADTTPHLPISIPQPPSVSLSKRRIEPVKPSKTSSQKSSLLSQCQECDRAFRYPKDLERHKRSLHVGLSCRWFCPHSVCKFSGQGFSRKDKFFQHIRTHSDGMNVASSLEQIAQSCYRIPFPQLERGFTRVKSLSESPKASQSLVSGHKDKKYSFMEIERGLRSDEDICGKTTASVSQTAPSSPSFDLISRPEILETTLSSMSGFEVTRSVEEEKIYNCTVSKCQSKFTHKYDLCRHEKTVHMSQGAGEGYRCASVGCKKADKIWTRLDNFKQHLARRHGNEDIDQLVRKSTRLIHGVEANFIFNIETPEMVCQKRSANRNITKQTAPNSRQSNSLRPGSSPFGQDELEYNDEFEASWRDFVDFDKYCICQDSD
jgi:hypothetical protein